MLLSWLCLVRWTFGAASGQPVKLVDLVQGLSRCFIPCLPGFLNPLVLVGLDVSHAMHAQMCKGQDERQG